MKHSRLVKGFALALITLTGAVFVIAGSPVIRGAVASERCNAPLADWKPRDAVYAMAHEKGWRIDKLKVDDGCYQIKGHDTDGRRFKAKLDPATLDVHRLKHEDDDDDGHEHEGSGEREHRRAAPGGVATGNAAAAPAVASAAASAVAPAVAPPGGLVTPGSKPSAQIR